MNAHLGPIPPGTTMPGGPAPLGRPAAGPDGLVWRRVHPVTPLVKGWKAIAVIAAVIAQQLGDNLARGLDLVRGSGLTVLLGGLLAVVLVVTGLSWLSWRMTRYAIDAQAIHLRQGVIFRQQRQARLDRLQAVDIVQPIVARIFGLAELKLEVAGGADSAIKLSFLKESEANVLRNELLARAAGVVTAERGVDAPVPAPPPERHIVSVPLSRLIGSIILTPSMLVVVIVAIAVPAGMIIAGDPGAIVLLPATLFSVVGVLWKEFNQGFNFQAAIAPDGIRLRHGLTEARSQTLPPGRIQAVRLRRRLLWRWADWWRVDVNVAGYGQKQGATETVLLPVGTRDEALLALWLVLPDLGVPDARAFLDAALNGSGSGSAAGFTTCPRRSRWLSPLAWRVQGVALTDRAAILRRGRFSRVVEFVPFERTQSVGISQGPVARGFGVATLTLHSTHGAIRPVVDHLAAADVADLANQVVNRSRAARATAAPEQWLSRVRAAGLPVAGPVGAAGGGS